MMELEENELEREAANWAKSEKFREEGQEGRAEGPQGSVRTPEPGKGIGIVIKNEKQGGDGLVGGCKRKREVGIGMGGNGGRIGRCFG